MENKQNEEKKNCISFIIAFYFLNSEMFFLLYSNRETTYRLTYATYILRLHRDIIYRIRYKKNKITESKFILFS